MPIDIATTRFAKDDLHSYDLSVVNIAQELNANFILITFTTTSGKEERWFRKLIPEFIKASNEASIGVSFYMKLTNIMWQPMFNEHPESKEWVMLYQDGSPAVYSSNPARYMGCLNNPGWRAHLKQTIDEAILYGPAALFYDNCFVPMQTVGPRDEASAAEWACYCDTCKDLFKSYANKTLGRAYDLPTVPDWHDTIWQTFIKFRDKSLVDVLDMITKHAHALDPNILVYPNVCPPYQGGGGAKGSATKEIAKVVDLLLFEKGGSPALATPPQGGLPRPSTIAVDYKYGASLKTSPVWYRLNKRSDTYTAQQIQLGMAEASAFNGANHHVMAHHHSRDPDKAESIRRYYTFLKNNSECYTGVRQMADVAVLASTPTAHWYYPDRVSQGHPLPQDLRGMGQALVEMHIPFNIVTEDDLATGLKDYRALVIPNAACMSDKHIAAISEFVERGGGLVTTGISSLYDEDYRLRKDFGLAEILGVHHRHQQDDTVKNSFGSGLSVYIPGTPEQEFWDRGSPENASLIKDALSHVLQADWQIEVDAPHVVVINVAEKIISGVTLLHLVNFDLWLTENQLPTNITPSSKSSRFTRRVEGITVKLRKPPDKSMSKIRLISPDFDDEPRLKPHETAAHLSFVIPVLKVYNVIEIKWH